MEQQLMDEILEVLQKYKDTYGLSVKECVLVLDLLHAHFQQEALKIITK